MPKCFFHRTFCVFSCLLAVAWLIPPEAEAEGRLAGHFGIVLPLLTSVDGETITLDDDFNIGFPMGITVKTGERFAFDLELVTGLDNSPERQVSLTVHPGVLYSLRSPYTVGIRMAFDIENEAWGFTPLIARGFPIKGKSASYFIELDFPIRFLEGGDTAVGIAFHTGIGF